MHFNDIVNLAFTESGHALHKGKDGTNMQILIVEDDLVIAAELSQAIEDEGFFCDTCDSTAEAMELLRHADYGVAILDHYLQGETTVFLSSHLRLRHPTTKIITITGSSIFANGYGLDRLGTDFLFRKPFAASDLVEIVKYLRTTPPNPGNQHLQSERTISRHQSA